MALHHGKSQIRWEFIVRSRQAVVCMWGFYHFHYDLDGKEAFVACVNTLFKDVWPCKDEKEEKFPSDEPKSESLSLK